MRGPKALARGNSTDRWEKGVFLGYSNDANTYLYSTTAGVQTSRCLEQLPFPNRWSLESLAELKATPSTMHVPGDPGMILRERNEGIEQPSRADAKAKVRKLKITIEDLDRFGFTEGCPQCTHILRYRSGRPGYAHTDTCRQRVMNAMMETPDGQERLARLEERVDRALAEHVEEHARAEGTQVGGDIPRGDNGDLLDPHMAEAPADLPRDASLPGTRVPESGPGSRPPPDDDGDVETQEGVGDRMADDIENAADVPMAQTATTHRRFCRPRFPKQAMMLGQRNVDYEDEVIMLVGAMGGDVKGYRRERRQAAQRMIAEVYSPPRVTAMIKSLPSLKLVPGFALDLTTIDELDGLPWDFTDSVKRQRALTLATTQKPMLVVGSPSCRAFSS